MIAMDILAQLQAWYAQHCNGEWEHSSGITIQTCDNPGWWVKVDLAGTPLQKRVFVEIAEGVDEQRVALGPVWLSCYRNMNVWHGGGDAAKLERILEIFLAWADEADD